RPRRSGEGNMRTVSISCLSVISPVGYTPQSTAAALRAGISAFDELVYREKGGDSVIGAMVADVPVETRGRARLRSLATLAFEALPREFVRTVPWQQMTIFLCMPERQRPGPRLRETLADLRLPDGKALESAPTKLVEGGPVSAFEAIDQARGLL